MTSFEHCKQRGELEAVAAMGLPPATNASLGDNVAATCMLDGVNLHNPVCVHLYSCKTLRLSTKCAAPARLSCLHTSRV